MTVTADFDELYSAHAAAVYHACLRAVSRPEAAEALTSEVFAALHDDSRTMASDGLPAWLVQTAKQRATEYWQSQNIGQHWVVTHERTSITGGAPGPTLDGMLESCPALKQVHRVCLILRFRHGMDRGPIAAHTGLSELQVKGHLQQAMRLLETDAELAGVPDVERVLTAQAQPGSCPSPELLFAATEDVLPTESGEAVREHAVSCKLCLTLLEGLSPAVAELTPAQDARIHERIVATMNPEQLEEGFGEGEQTAWRMAGPIIVVVLLAIGSVGTYRLVHRPANAANEAQVRSQAAPAASVQDFEELHKLVPLAMPTPTGIMEPAAKAYNQGNFDAAAAELVPIVARYPSDGTPSLYLGIAQLELNRNAEARINLSRAVALTQSQQRIEAEWYLAIAQLRTGQTADAVAGLHAVCTTASVHAARACSLAVQFSSGSR